MLLFCHFHNILRGIYIYFNFCQWTIKQYLRCLIYKSYFVSHFYVVEFLSLRKRKDSIKMCKCIHFPFFCIFNIYSMIPPPPLPQQFSSALKRTLGLERVPLRIDILSGYKNLNSKHCFDPRWVKHYLGFNDSYYCFCLIFDFLSFTFPPLSTSLISVLLGNMIKRSNKSRNLL